MLTLAGTTHANTTVFARVIITITTDNFITFIASHLTILTDILAAFMAGFINTRRTAVFIATSACGRAIIAHSVTAVGARFNT